MNKEMNQQAKKKILYNAMNERLWRQLHRYNSQNKISYLHSMAMNLYILNSNIWILQ